VHSNGMLPAQARHYLAHYLFRGEDVFKLVGALSGGERGRLTLAILALDEVNFLILDEPTNHLDLPTQEVLEEALLQFGGTILLVTHDRYLINQLATQIWDLREGQLHVHNGNYASYLAAREQAVKQAEEAKARTSVNGKQNPRQGKTTVVDTAKELAQTEERIHELETVLSRLAEELETAAKIQQMDRIKTLSRSYKETEAQLEILMSKWETLSVSN
jgi:ATP-binding cassette subfamily F protein 3